MTQITPKRKGKVAYPKEDDAEMPRLGQRRLTDGGLIEFTKVTLEELERIEELKKLLNDKLD